MATSPNSKIHSIVFWQQFLSMHQIDLLLALTKFAKIILVIDRIEDEVRKNMGWSLGDLTYLDIEIFQSPSNSQLAYIINIPSNTHIFSGFSQGEALKKGLSLMVKYGIRYVLMAESPDINKMPLVESILRHIKYSLFFYFNRKLIKGVLAIGANGVKFYNKMPIENERVQSFGYFVGLKSSSYIKNDGDDKIRLIYVGRLVKYKGIIELLNALYLLPDNVKNRVVLKIYGDGPLKNDVIAYFKGINTKISIEVFDFVDNYLIRKAVSDSDILCLTNISDEGWGVVVNEAILEGTYVVCGEFTGASILIEKSDTDIGTIINNVNKETIKATLVEICENIDYIKSNRGKRKQWSLKIFPNSAAVYLLESLLYFNELGDRPIAPWEKINIS